MPGNVYSLPFRFAAPVATDTAVYAVQDATTPVRRFCVVDISIGSSASADNAAAYTVRYITAEHGTPTGNALATPWPLDPDGPAAGHTGRESVTVAGTPTYTASKYLAQFGLNQRGLHRWCNLPNRGIWAAKTAGHGIGLEITTLATAFVMHGHMHVEE